MKKKFAALLVTIAGALSLSACSLLDDILSNITGGDEEKETQNPGQESQYTCPSCSESFVDQPSHEGPHQYEAETCKLCQRDIMLDFIEKFNTHGNETTDYIMLDSEQELISLFHYVHLNRVRKYFQLTYTPDGFISMSKYLSKVAGKTCDAACMRIYGFGADKTGYVENNNEQFVDNYTKKSGVDYPESVKEELENPIDDIFLSKGNRSNTFDDFKIYNRHYELNCQTGDDLFYACTHGYKPKVASGSNAETVLNRVKEILRGIINDSMTDIEKAFAMYCWLVKNVQYDDGAVAAVDSDSIDNTELAAWGIEGSIFEGKAICDSFSKTFAVFCGMENIRCIQISGNNHAWNRIYLNLDGSFKWYVVDPTWGNGDSGSFESASHSQFLYDDASKAEMHFSGDNYQDTPALQDINQYKYIKYDGVNDWFIENDTEFNNYIQYIGNYVKELHNAGKSVNIELALPLGEHEYVPSSTVKSNAFTNYLGWTTSSYSYSLDEYPGYQVIGYSYRA